MNLCFSSREELEFSIVTLYADGWSKRALSRHFQMSRNTIRRILKKHNQDREQGHDALGRGKTRRKSKLDSYMPLIRQLMEKYPKITGQRLFEELQDAGFTGGITIVRERLSKLRPSPKREPVVRFETEPGEQGQMDWSPYKIDFAKGGKTDVLCFSYILGFSRRQYIDFTEDRKFFTLIRRHQDAFAHFRGVPRHCLYDGEKTVLLRWEAGRPIYNPAFIAFITHYRCRPVGCRPGRPQTKGKIEAPFNFVEKNLLCARTFQDMEDLRKMARWWLANKSDLHVHDTTRRPPLELFIEKEAAALLPLPDHPYDTSEVVLRVGRSDGFIEFETNYYSIPYESVADILAVKATEHEVSIYSPELCRIAHHERLPKGLGKRIENPDHRRSKRIRYGLEPVKEAFLLLGDDSEAFLLRLKEKHPKNCGFHARLILAMKEEYHAEDINRALAHAAAYHAFDGKAIERILKAKYQKRTLESMRNQKAGKALEKVLPKIKQRSLAEYGDLLKKDEEE